MQLQILVSLATVVVSFWGGKHWVKMAHDQEDWVYIGKGNRIVLKQGETRKIQVGEKSNFCLQMGNTKKRIMIDDVKVVCRETHEDCGNCTTGVYGPKPDSKPDSKPHKPEYDHFSLIKVKVENQEPISVCLDTPTNVLSNPPVCFKLITVANMRNSYVDRAFVEICWLKNDTTECDKNNVQCAKAESECETFTEKLQKFLTSISPFAQ